MATLLFILLKMCHENGSVMTTKISISRLLNSEIYQPVLKVLDTAKQNNSPNTKFSEN